jgi:ATP-dependent DNA helicase RecQ
MALVVRRAPQTDRASGDPLHSPAFLERSLLLDLETKGQEHVHHIGAVLGRDTFERQGRFDLDDALAELDRWARQADFGLGHNLIGHDLPSGAAVAISGQDIERYIGEPPRASGEA